MDFNSERVCAEKVVDLIRIRQQNQGTRYGRAIDHDRRFMKLLQMEHVVLFGAWKGVESSFNGLVNNVL